MNGGGIRMDIKDNKDIALAVPGLSDISNSYMEDFLSEIRNSGRYRA
jgi:hypothetical protein